MAKQDRPDRERYAEGTAGQFETEELRLGPWSSYSLMHDPKHLSFVLARYKFCAKMLDGLASVVEVGSGDGLGLPIVAQAVGHLYAVDWDPRLLEGNARRLSFLKNVTYLNVDLNQDDLDVRADGVYTVDVLEHLEPASEKTFIERLVRCLGPQGVMITGTPNAAAEQYASPQSRSQHINLKTMAELRELMGRYFHNVFMFGMNDEVLHTGHAPMCHYLWAVAVGVRGVQAKAT
jgi:2-polyprenyl-3-methyl-5-hydroxy-6-metoxy-1,4-benzoquinol methylase